MAKSPVHSTHRRHRTSSYSTKRARSSTPDWVANRTSRPRSRKPYRASCWLTSAGDTAEKNRGVLAPRFFLLVRLTFRGGCQAVDDRAKFRVSRRRQHLERLRDVGDAPIRANDEQRAVVELVLGIEGAIHLAHCPARITGEYNRKILVACPGGERGIRIDADADDGYVAAVVEERGVLITVRLHLDRSAFGPRLEKESEYDGSTTII